MPGTQEWPPTDVVAYRNRHILAERLDWPDGAVEACERIERERPGWSVWWLGENTCRGFERPAQFTATRDGYDGTQVDAADADQLLAAIDDAPPTHRWSLPLGEHCMCRRCQF